MLSYWEKTTAFQKADIIIIGAGFTGLSLALEYKSRHNNHRVLVLERGAIPSGASTKNAGFACFGSISEVVEDLNNTPFEAVYSLIESRFKGIEHWKKMFGNIDFQLSGGVELFRDQESAIHENCLNQLESINEFMYSITGLKETYTSCLDYKKFNGIRQSVSNEMEGVLHSGKLYYALLSKVLNEGIQVLNGVDVLQIIESEKHIEAHTNHGIVSSEFMIVANNSGAAKLLPELDVFPARGQIIMTDEIPSLPFQGSFHLNCGYYYFRNVGNRVLLGGGRHLDVLGERTFSQETTSKMTAHLEDILRTYILPNQPFNIAESWAGTMAFGDKNEKEPLLGALSDRLYYAVRFGGMGVALAPIKAIELIKTHFS